mgnify:CR=1 FL=1
MIRLEAIERIMRPQFIWSKSPQKKLQVNETFEGNLELARIVFVGLADMYGFDSSDVMSYLDCGYDTYRNKLMQFRSAWKECKNREEQKILYDFVDMSSKIYIKTCFCLNAIRYESGRNPYLRMAEYIEV